MPNQLLQSGFEKRAILRLHLTLHLKEKFSLYLPLRNPIISLSFYLSSQGFLVASKDLKVNIVLNSIYLFRSILIS